MVLPCQAIASQALVPAQAAASVTRRLGDKEWEAVELLTFDLVGDPALLDHPVTRCAEMPCHDFGTQPPKPSGHELPHYCGEAIEVHRLPEVEFFLTGCLLGLLDLLLVVERTEQLLDLAFPAEERDGEHGAGRQQFVLHQPLQHTRRIAQPLVQVQHAGAIIKASDADLGHVVEFIRRMQPFDIGFYGREGRESTAPPPGDLDHRIVDVDRGHGHAGSQQLLSENTGAGAEIKQSPKVALGVAIGVAMSIDMGVDQGDIAGKVTEDALRRRRIQTDQRLLLVGTLEVILVDLPMLGVVDI